jgi:hypothetical protein
MARSKYWWDTKDDTLIVYNSSTDKFVELPNSRSTIKDLSSSNEREQHSIIKAKVELNEHGKD